MLQRSDNDVTGALNSPEQLTKQYVKYLYLLRNSILYIIDNKKTLMKVISDKYIL